MPDLIDLAAIDDSTALVFGERRVPRREFAARVAVLARELIDRGVGPDVPVAVVMPRSVELLVALHAIIAAGGAYVPVDPEAPAERAAYMVSTAGATLVLVRAGELPPAIRGLGEGVQFGEVDADGAVDLDVALVTDADRNGPLRPEHAAYTLFTSGSTGQPKGVTVSHRAIANRLAWMRDWYAIGASDVFVQKTPATFDVSVWELFLPAVVGATLVIAEPDRHGEPDYLADLIQRERVTVVHFVPSMLAAFTDVLGAELGALRSLRLVFTSGEALTAPVARRLIDVLPGAALHNLYGPTEAAVDVTAHHVVASDSTIPIGVPVPRTSAYVLDSRLQWVPAGVPGELYLGGVQLARAYADRPDLTAERFVADPFAAPGDRLYRTGDLVRWSSGGELEYLGRTDFQVKLRGQRMELGEVEAVILSAPGVVNAAAAVVDFPAGAQLVGYVAPESVDPAALDAAMAAKLPEYMRPSRWVTLPELPLNAAGKVARRQLPRPEAPALEYVAPESEAERLVADVFAGILGVDRVSVSESFFDLGGNSLAATRVAARVSDVLGVAVSVRDVFDAATVRALVVAVAGRRPALAPVAPVVPRPERIPLSFAQHRMWFINQLEPELPTYNIPAVLRLTGELDLGALRAALADVVERHEVLRTTFPSVDGEPYQSVSPAAEVATRLDWAELDDPTEFEAAMRRGFHVGVQWPLRARVLRVNDREALFGIVAHHIGYDGQSFGPLVADFVTAFAARARGEVPVFLPLPVQFADFALWQHRVLGDPADTESVLGRQLNFWRQHLAGVPDVLELPTDHVRPPVASHAGDVVRFAIPGEVSQRLDAYAADHGVTRFMVLHAVFALLLARLAATDDVVLGTPIAGRGQRQLDGLVGMFANTLVLRTRIDPAASFEALLATVRDTDLTAFEHSEVPFESIVDALNPVRSEAFSPLVQVILSVDPLSASDTVSVGGLDVSPVDITEIPAQLDLDLTLLTDSEEWIGKLTFATDLFERSRIERMGEQFVRVLGAALAAPTTAVGDLPLLAAGDRAALVRESVGPVRPVLDETIADAVAASAALVPDAVALVTGGREISYAEFGCRVGDLARRLIAAGVASDDAVGLVMDRSAELVIAVHAILAAGGQYVPIAVDSPVDRATYAAATAGVRLVLVRAGAELPEFVSELAVPVIEVDASGDLPVGARPLDPAERQRPLRSSDAAYTLFTSGSTGLPKGVTVSHRAVRNFVGWFGRLVPEGDQRLLFKTPHTFDASVLELFWPLVAGQTMVIADAQGHRDPRYLATVMNDAGVSVVQFVPSLLAAFLDVVGDEPLLPGLRVLFSGGEALPPAVAVNFRERAPQARLVNLFGPTEAAVYTVAAELATPGDVVPIGAPMTNTTAFVLDDRLHPVPDGVVGELYLGGVQSARGYAARPDLTAERFVADPFGAPGDRLYRTGDLVRRGHSAELEYLGRTDFQVKIRGQRLELGEVEAAIVAGPGVVHAAVRVVAGAVGDQLVGYVAPASVDVDALGADLARRLPDYMVPTMWVPLAEMPLNSAGKVDRRALPDPVFEAAEFVAPDTPDEAAVAAVYADLLGVERVSVTESFFDLGGNSLSAMRLVARAGEVLGVEVSVRDVFDAPTVRELVTAVADRAEALPPVVRVDPRPERVPLSFAQQRMWFINRFDSSLPTYNIPVVLRITGVLDVAALRVAVADVVERHEVLRTRFPEFEGEPVQLIADRAMVGVSLPWWEVDSEERLVAEVTRGFDVTVEWPIRAIVYRVGVDEWLFGVVAHHIATDGESMLPLVADVMGAYAARRSGAVPGFEPLPVQFADFAIWQRAVLGSPEAPDSVIGRQLEYWRACLADLPDVLELPADRKRPAVASYRGAEVPFEVPEAVARRVAAVGGAHGVTPFMVVHAALAVLLARLSATDDIAIVTPVAGRGQVELDRLVGMFVNTLVLRTRVGSSMSFTDLLRQVRQVDLDAFAHADVPFEAVVDALDPVRSEAFAPLAQVMLSFDPSASARGVDAAVEGLRIEALPDPVVPAQVDLTFRVMSDPAGGWSGTVVFATDLFDPATARWFAERFVAVLDELTADPGGAVGDAVVLDARDRERADAAAVGPVVPVPAMTLADAVAAAAARTPDAVAVVFEGRSVSYAEFGARVAVLARELIGVGVGPDVAVGVCIDRSVELLVAIHAVVAAGGRYVPLDVDVPAERARVMLETAGAEISLVAAGQVSGASEVLAGRRCVEVDAAGHVDVTVAPVTDAERLSPLRGDHAVYTLFTSGSTGVPKGVTVSHAAVMNRLVWMRDDYSIDCEDRFVLKTPYTFDVSVWELFLPFLVGARLVVARPDGHRDPQYLAAEIARESVSVVHFVPSMLAVFLDVVGERVGDLGSLSRVFTSGEALPAALAQDVLSALPLAELHNLYGPTEAAVDVTAERVLAGAGLVTIGRPVANTRAVVLDSRLHPVPDGVPGELYLGGVQLARGYASRADLTAERFVADPQGLPGSRLYRTGDLVRRLGDGSLDYLGRTDFQVKLRGQRIELSEIESVIASAPGVVHVAATVAQAPAGGEFLVAYVSPSSVDLAALRDHAATALPEYMRPSVWTLLDEVALNSAGKLDRRALPAPDFGTADHEYVAPEGRAEAALAEIVAEVLGVDRVSVTESFFDSGGNSLSAMRVVARAGEALGVELSIRDLFEAPTVRGLVAASADRAAALPPVTAVVPRPSEIPLSFAQQRMWLVNQADPASGAYNIPMGLRITGPLDLDALHAAMVDVVLRHEVLRTTFPSVEGQPRQRIARDSSVAARMDWDVVESFEEIQDALTSGFNLTRQAPVRIRVFAAGPDEHIVVVVVHHIAFDGESMAPFVTDLVTAYLAEADDRDPEFAALPFGFADYAIWQHEVLGRPDDPASVVGGQLEYWRSQLAGLPELVELPLDRPRPAVASQRGAVVPFVIAAETARKITLLADRSGSTPFMIVHAALAALVARMTGQRDIAIGSPIAGRGQVGLDGLVGMFVNTLVLRTEVRRGMTFEELVAEAKRVDLAAYDNADVPFDTVVDELAVAQSPAFSPFTQVWLTFNQTDVPELAGEKLTGTEIGGLTIEPLAQTEHPAKVDLLVAVEQSDGDWSGGLVYAADLFDERSMIVFAAYLVAVVEQAVADPALAVTSLALPEHVVAEESVPATPAAPGALPVRTARPIPAGGPIVSGGDGTDPVLLSEIFAHAADRWGPRQAVVDPDGSYLTYADLDARSNRLARWLIGHGVGSEQLVALAMERSSQLLVAIWAVAKTGAGYVPIDPTYPADRVIAMVEDSGAMIGLTAGAPGELPAGDFSWYRLDDRELNATVDGLDAAPLAEAERVRPVYVDNTAYVIFTSGSTGRPKGVAVTHSGLANFAAEEVRLAEADERARVLGFASPSFDASVLEYLLAARSGGVLVYRPSGAVGGQVLQDFIMRQAVTHTFLTPSVLATMDPAMLPSLRVVYAGGEAVPQALKDRWAMFPRIQNLYGPTETTIGVAISAPMQIGAPVYLGGPLAGVGFLVLDDELQPVPVGVPGELYVCGDQLSRGYLGVPVLTASRFVANPFGIAGDRMYRTGDVVRWRQSDDGRRVIEYTGRSDDQIKLRGLRIELGEIETVLAGHADVTTAVVVGVGGSVATALAAYVTPRTGAVVNSAQLRAYLADRLPSHMVPAAVTVLDEMPLTPVGKLDKNALPEPVIDHAEYVSPEDGAETVIAEVFAEILGMDQVSATASFFDLGGNSLSAMRVVGRVGEALDVEISIADVFAAPTVRQLALALGGRGHALPAVTIVTPRPEPVPLSFAQRRMWFINRLDPSAPTYNIPGAVRLRGSLDRVALKQAMADVVARHEVLRTVFPDREGVPAQVVIDADDVDSALDWDVAESVADVADVLAQGFDVTTELPLRVRLLSESDDSAILAFVFHHIAFDGQSFGPMLADLLTAYAARAAGGVPEFAELPVQYADYALWQRDVLGSPDQEESILGQQLAFWTDTLAGAPEVIDLPTDRPRPPVFSPDGGQVGFAIPAELGARVDEFAAQAGATRFMVLHAAFAVLLSRLSGADDVVLGTPFDGRGPRGLGALVGMFVNTVVLRSRVRPGESFESLTAATRDADLAAFAHADMPFESVVDAVDPVRSEAFSPLVQVILSVDPVAEVPDEVAVAGVVVEPYGDYQIPAQMDLNLTVSAGEESGDWSAVLTYPTALFDRSSVVTLGDRFVGVLEGLLTDPEAPVGDLVLLADTESAEILAESTGPEVPWLEETIADAVAARVAAAPSAIALVAGARELSYGEFGARVGELARRLIAAGVGPESAVGLVMDRSVELVVAVHAVLAAGGQYVPIAVDSPADRAVFVASTAGVGTVLVAAGAQVPDFVSSMAVPVLEVDCSNELAAGTEPLSAAERSGVLRSPDAAYTLFTSGSTGLPKGVTVSHGAVRNFVAWFDETVPAGAQRLLFKTPHTFDASVLELFWPLVAGQTMVIADVGGERDPRYLAEVINDAEVSVAQFVPSLLSAFLDVVDDAELLPGLRVLFSGGEALPPAVARDFRRRVPHAKLVNLFGPTEAAVYSMSAVLDVVGETVPIGAPMANTTALILDSRLQLVPVGVAGELYLGGVQSARGYAERPDLTAERFVADPFSAPGARLYRTGDLARRTSSGALDYLGRTDFQVKLRGQRLELGEVESAIAAAEGVVHAAARVAAGPAGDQLVGYVAPASVDTGAVAGELARRLPGYMVPTVWVALDEMPLNTAGKVDRRALPEPEFEAVEYMAPATAAEESVAAVFADLLGVERVSVTASFFDLGGNSLAAMRLVARVADVLGVQVSVRDVFDAPSVRELVAAVADRPAALPPVTAQEPRPGLIPLTRAQLRMWYLNQVDPSSATYNVPMAVRLSGDVDVQALTAAIRDALDRHEVLRTIYPAQGATPRQEILAVDAALERFDWAEAGSLDDLISAATTGFDVSTDLPVRGRIRRGDDGVVELAIVAHHIAFDGESTPVLLRDVLAAYAHRVDPAAPAQPQLAVQYADFAIWEHDVLGDASDPETPLGRQTAYWREKLRGLPEVTDLPMDRPRPDVFDSRGDLVTLVVDDELALGIDELCRAYRVTPFMVTYAALVVLIARLAATSDAVVAAPTAGRTSAALDDLVGMFVNTLVLRADAAPGHSVDDLLRAVRKDVLDAFANADVQFDELVEVLAPRRSTAYSPLAQIAFTFAEQPAHDDAVSVGDIQAEPVEVGGHEAKFDLMVVAAAKTAATPMSVGFLYSAALYVKRTVEGFAEVYQRILAAMVADQRVAIGDIDILGPRAQDRAPEPRVAAGSTGGHVEEGTLIELLSRRELDGYHPALICGDEEIDYDEFEARTDRVARALLGRGVTPDDVVVLGLRRSIDSVVAMWGVVKAGAAYAAIDPDGSAGQLAVLLDGSSVALAVSRAEDADAPGLQGREWLDLAELAAEADSAAPISDAERGCPVRVANLAYVVGPAQSGERAGPVAMPQSGAAGLVAAFGKVTGTLDDDPDTRILHLAKPGTDRAFAETAWAVTMGHTLVIVAPGSESGGDLGEILDAGEVTDLMVTPGDLDSVDPDSAEYVRNLILVAASCPDEVVVQWQARGRRLFTAYDDAGMMGSVTRSRVTGRAPITAGRPVDGVAVRVLGEHATAVRAGETGALAFAGSGLARGYLGAAAETAARFVADPCGEPGTRMYRASECGRIVEDHLEIVVEGSE